MATFFFVIQVVTALSLVVLIALQGKGSGLSGGILGGSSQVYHARKGVERFLFRLTIILGVIFLISSLVCVLV